jgi:hypothetical protein
LSLNALCKTSLSNKIPINKDFEKSMLGKNSSPEQSPVIIKNKDRPKSTLF